MTFPVFLTDTNPFPEITKLIAFSNHTFTDVLLWWDETNKQGLGSG